MVYQDAWSNMEEAKVQRDIRNANNPYNRPNKQNNLTKDKKGILVVVKHVRYYVKLSEVKEVLEGKREYTLVYEPPLLVGQ